MGSSARISCGCANSARATSWAESRRTGLPVALDEILTGPDVLLQALADDAIDAAAGLAGLERGSFGTKLLETELSPTEQLIVDFLATAKRVGINPSLFVSQPTTLQLLAGRFEKALNPLTRFNDPKGVYAHCLCNFDR